MILRHYEGDTKIELLYDCIVTINFNLIKFLYTSPFLITVMHIITQFAVFILFFQKQLLSSL